MTEFESVRTAIRRDVRAVGVSDRVAVDRVCDALDRALLEGYAREAAWRAFIAAVDGLLASSPAADPPPRAAIARLTQIVAENADLLDDARRRSRSARPA